MNWANAINNAFSRTIDLNPGTPPSPRRPSTGGGTSSGRKIGKLHDGGIVPGPRGQEVLAVLQAGEKVTPLSGNGAGGDIYITVEGSVVTERRLETVVAEALAKRDRRTR